MEILPKEIIQFEILPRLPAKPLTRFKSVSKEWYRLINDTTFINRHHKRTLESPTLDDMILVVPDRRDVRFYTQFDSVPQTKGNGTILHASPAAVVGFCNGFICLRLDGGRCYSVYDLLTNTKIINYRIPCPIHTLYTVKQSQQYGFGYDDVGHVYKIVSIQTRVHIYQWVVVVNIFSTDTRSWETVTDFPSSGALLHCPGVYINNKLYWIVQIGSEYKCIGLDLHTHVIVKMSLPTNTDYYRYTKLDLMVMGRVLYLLTVFRELVTSVDCSAELWVMKEYGVAESWTKLHVYRFSPDFQPKWLITFNPKEQAILTARRADEPVWYALQDDSTTRLDFLSGRDESASACVAKPWVCVTTLASGGDRLKSHNLF